MPDPIPTRTLHLNSRRVGQRVLVYDTVTSTNDLAAALGPEDDGTAVVAAQQTAGRGQYGRSWVSRPGDSLLLSVRLSPPPEVCRPVVLVALVAVAVAESIQTLTGAHPRVKWPNDLLVGGRKVCGVLIEQSAQGSRSVVIVGVGLNLNQTDADFRTAGLPDATSLAELAGSTFDPLDVASVVLGRLDEEYDRLLSGDRLPLEVAWADRLGLLGRPARADFHSGRVADGRVQRIGFDGVTLATVDGTLAIPAEQIRHLTAV